MSDFPIITVCGSMRYYKLMIECAEKLTRRGNIVIMPFVAIGPAEQGGGIREMLDEMHQEKIRMADAIYVVGGHIGLSTRSEIDYAKSLGILVLFHTDEISKRQSGIDIKPL